MLSQIGPYVDGYFGYEREVTTSPAPKFPFINQVTPDSYTRQYERYFRVIPNFYIPRLAARSSWTNLILQSEQINLPVWTLTNATATVNTDTAPDGNLAMDSLLETAANGEHSLAQSVTVENAQVEASVFVAASLGRSWAKLQFTDSASSAFYVIADLSSASVYSISGASTAKVQAFGNGHIRIVMRFTAAAGAGTFKLIVGSSSTSFSYAGDTAKGIRVWGAQVMKLDAVSVPMPIPPYVGTTDTARTVIAPDVDPIDPMAYLVEEDDIVMENSSTGTVRRLYSRIPIQQIVPDDLFVTQSSLSGSFPQTLGSYRLFQPDSTLAKYDAYERHAVTSDTGAPSSFHPSGGTATLAFIGYSTSATNYNATSGTWQTNLNALSSVTNAGGCTVTGGPLSSTDMVVTFANYATGSVDSSSLTGTTGSTITSSVTSSDGGYRQAVVIKKGPIDSPSSTMTTSGLVTGTGGTLRATVTESLSSYYPNSTISFSVGNYIDNIIGGTYLLTFYGQTTSPIAWNANRATVQAAINAACSTLLSRGDVEVLSVGVSSFVIDIAISVTPKITGGSYKVTMFGQQTGAIAYNASLSDIALALNTLTNVAAKGGCSVVWGIGSAAQIGFTMNFTGQLLTANTSSLTPSGCVATITAIGSGSGRQQNISIVAPSTTRTFYVASGHGVFSGDTIMLRNNSADYSGVTNFAIADPNTIVLTVAPSDPFASAATITELGRRSCKGYAPSSSPFRAQYITDSYMIGVTAGVDSIADVPRAAAQADSATVLQAISGGATELNYQVGQLKQWKGAILSRTTTVINPSTILQ